MSIKIGGITLFTLDELCEKLEVTTETMRAYIKDGKLKGQKVGVRWLVSEEAFRDFFLSPYMQVSKPEAKDKLETTQNKEIILCKGHECWEYDSQPAKPTGVKGAIIVENSMPISLHLYTNKYFAFATKSDNGEFVGTYRDKNPTPPEKGEIELSYCFKDNLHVFEGFYKGNYSEQDKGNYTIKLKEI